MTTVEKLIENYLICVICSDEFTNPGTLQCNHTFCRPCILKYTKTQPEAIEAKCIPCPVCRQLSKVTSPDYPVHEWVNQVKPSQNIQKLIDLFGPKIKDGSICSVCADGRETTPGTFWCFDCKAGFCDMCLRYHRRMPLSRNHEVCNLVEETKRNSLRKLKCAKHTDESIYHFCTDCMSAMCTVCLSLYHNRCMNVLVIKDTLPEDTDKIETNTSVPEETDKTEQRTTQDGICTEEMDETESQIRTTCQNAIAVILDTKKKLISDVNVIRTGQTKLLEAEINSEEATIGRLQQTMQDIDRALKSGCEKDMFDVYDLCEFYNEEVNGKKDIVKPLIPRFKPTFGNLKTCISEVIISESLTVPGKEANDLAVLYESIGVRHTDDKAFPYLTDIAVLTTSGNKWIIVTDFDNKKLKSVTKKSGRQNLTTLAFEKSPFCVSKYDCTHVIVTVPSSRKIWKVSIDPRLSVSKMIATTQRYYGISCLDEDRLVACTDSRSRTFSFQHSSSLDILDFHGTVLQSVRSRAIPSPMFVFATPDGNTLVSDMKSKTLVSLTPKGKAVFTYKPSKARAPPVRPRGVVACGNGSILLVDGDSNTVKQLTRSGNYVKDILTSVDGLDRPCGICLDDEELIYVTSGQYIKVFRLL